MSQGFASSETETGQAAPETEGPKEVKLPSDRGWLRFGNLKVEAALFLLIAVTFAAVLGQEAFTSKQLVIDPHSTHYYSYSYSDKNDGGNTTVTPESSSPLKWRCDLKPGVEYAYCGYGLWLDQDNKGKGVDFSKYKDVEVHLTYHGVGTRMKLTVQSEPPAALKGKIAKGETMPMVAMFDVVQGENDVHLSTGQFKTEQWWIAKHSIAPDDATSNLDNILAFAFGSGDKTPNGRLDVDVQRMTFKGVSISTDQWYLIILGVWLVATGAFLVVRFLGMRRTYEARQRQQAQEAQALAKARTAAEDASAAKSQFLANMSHELRTPLNAILGYAQLLNSTALDDTQTSAVRTIHSSGEHLLTVITDILDIAKVEAGKLELLPGNCDLHGLVQGVGQMIRLRAEEKGLAFVVAIADDVPATVFTDQKRLRQVLINLLGNAIKFTQAGEVRLDVSVVSGDADTVRLRFDVTDTGLGIEASHLDRIFRPFEQSGNSVNRSGGTGLGLSITHKIVQMMGGDITVDSEMAKGSRFRIEATLPLAGADEDDALVGPLQAPVEAGLAATGLIIAPAGELHERLLLLAREGNLRALRKELPAILALGPQYKPFADRLDALASAYQSPAVLRLIESSAPDAAAA